MGIDPQKLAESIVETVREPLVVLDEKLRVILANRSFYRTFRVGREGAAGVPLFDLGGGHWDIPELRALLPGVLRDGAEIEGFEIACEFPVIGRKDLLVNAHRLPDDAAGHPTILLAVEDITERKRSEGTLRASEERWRTLVENSSDVITIITTDGVIRYESPSITRVLGYEPCELVGRDAFEFVHANDAERVAGVFRRIIDEGGVTQSVEYRFRHRDGSWRVLESVGKTFNDESGELVGLVNSRDVTEHRRAEAALRASEERYRLFFESNPIPMWAYDHETLRFLTVNDAAVKHYGYTREEFLSMTIRDIRPPEYVPALLECVTQIRQGASESGVWKHRKKSGEVIDVEITSHGISLGDRSAELVLANDVTERLRAESALRESEERYKSLCDSAFDGVVIHQDGTIKAANRAFAEMVGYTVEELIDSSLLEIVPPRMVEAVRAQIEGGAARYEAANLRKDGSLVSVEVSPTICLYDGRPARLAAVRDITERKRAEHELRESEERYRELVENARDVIFSHDLEGNYTSLNRAGERLFGYTREEVLGMNVSRVVAPECAERARRMLERKLAGEEETVYELDAITKDGRRVTVEVNTRLVFHDGAAVGVQGIARDVTARGQLEDQLRQAQKMESIGLLAGGVAHDFNNLLTAIQGNTQLAQRRVAADDPLRRRLDEIERAAQRAAGLTRQLLAFSRRQHLERRTLDLNESIRDIVKMVRRLIGEDIAVETKESPGLPPIYADPTQVDLVLMNLAVNARDAMPRGGTLTVETHESALDEAYCRRHAFARPGRYVELRVSDTGCGMDAETRARIFEPFFTTKRVGQGTGLGLAMVYGVVKQHEGYVNVYSEPGHGTTFKVYLPVAEEKAEEARPDAAQALPEGGTETILVAEDEEALRALMQDVLGGLGYNVLPAKDGEEAVDLFAARRGEIDLLLFDVVMPRMGGREAYERIRSLGDGRPPVIFMTGYSIDTVNSRFVSSGGLLESTGASLLQKPYTVEGIGRKVREALDGARTSRAPSPPAELGPRGRA